MQEKIQKPVPATTYNPALHGNMNLRGVVYCKEYHKVEDTTRFHGEEKNRLIKKALEICGLTENDHRDIPFWVLPAVKLREQGDMPLLFIGRFSEHTLKIAPIFGAIFVSYDIRHTLTADVKKDAGESRDHNGVNDIWLRNRVFKLKTPMFIQLQQ